MIEVPKLVLILLIGFLVWYAMRWVSGAPKSRRGRPTAAARPAGPPAIEDLVACRACGAYVAASMQACGKPGCPQPR